MEKPGNPDETWASTVTGWPSTPRTVAEETVASMDTPLVLARLRAARRTETRGGATREVERESTLPRGCDSP